MILLEITDEAGMTHYEILGISPQDLAGLDDAGIGKKIRRAGNDKRRAYTELAIKGDAFASAKLSKLNDSVTELSNPEKRKEYGEKLKSGKSGRSEILRVRSIAPPFFSDRNARFRVIERLMRETGLSETDDTQ
jgi:hypothetical protein